jgi:UDP-hydrolysing UDP-N-acetyl-D-glucosamine 2-epimerase
MISMDKSKRKVCIVVQSRANYGRIKSTMKAVKDHPDLELQLIVGASALLYRFGEAIEQMRADGFEPDATLHCILEGNKPGAMAKSTGIGIENLATIFEQLEPNIALTVADRFETMSTAVAASYMNIPVAHTQGGEVTGSIDESVRHAITKLSHLHFPATELAAENVIRMGEDPETVFRTGCPSIDAIANIDLEMSDDFFEEYGGVGAQINPSEPYLVVVQHPVTTEYKQGFAQIRETLDAVTNIGMQSVWLWPNVDAGTDDISKGLRVYREGQDNDLIRFYKNFSVEDYGRLIENAECIVGNSSSAIREGSYLGTPAVNIGTRQQGRQKAENVMDVGYDAGEVEVAIRHQIDHGKYEPSQLYGDGKAGGRIADLLASEDVSIQKSLSY